MSLQASTTKIIALLLLLISSGFLFTQCSAAPPPIEKLKVPPGFKVSVYSDQVPGARQMFLSDQGTLFVGSIVPNCVYALPDRNHDGVPDKVYTIAAGLNHPNGVAIKDGALLVGEVHRFIRYDNIEKSLEKPPEPVLVTDKIPHDEWHGYKYMRIGPDGLLYFGIGAPCNACIRKDDDRYASVMRMKPDGSNMEIFAKGVRNTIGFDWHPQTKELWFTDNGRDYLGDNLPPDELNCAPRKGMNFGFPFRYGNNVSDPEFGIKAPKIEFTPPAMPLGPHVASLGMRFYTGKMFPENYRDSIFIAEHGSWNRNKKIGYRITRVTLKDGKASKYETFMEGFLQGTEPWGRPVDICMMPDGSMLVSDDRLGAIYRITYSPPS